MADVAQVEGIAKQFVEYYYSLFSSDRSTLRPLYRPSSQMNWESQRFVGVEDIIEKLAALPFQKVQHKLTTQDAQLASSAGSIIVHVTGLLLVDEDSNPLHFSQVFHLAPEGGSYFVQNDFFRLNYG